MRRNGWLLLAILVPALAQEPDAAPQAEAAPASEAPAPRPALIAPLAERSILLGIAQAGRRLVAVGDRGHVLLSEDGRQWRQVAAPVNAMLNRVRFRNEKVGWAVGHDAVILATADGGETWALRHFDPAEGRPLYDMIALDEQRAVAVGGYGTYLESADGGQTWSPRSLPMTELGQHLNAITRLADRTLVIAGERGLIARSRDEGASWDVLDSPYSGSFFGVLPAGDKGALIFGLRGNLYVAPDIHAGKPLRLEDYDPFARETVPDAQALARTGWAPIGRPTTESLFGGALDGASAVLAGVNGVVVRVDPAQREAHLVHQAPATLNAVVQHGSSWIGVGRRGVHNLGTLEE